MILKGRVVRGKKYGRKIGFPTANIDRRRWKFLKEKPRDGIYAGRVSIKGNKNWRKAAVVIGPKDRGGLPRIEAHLIGLNGNLYGKKIFIKLQKFIRKYKKFKSEKELIAQIQKDIKKILDYLS